MRTSARRIAALWRRKNAFSQDQIGLVVLTALKWAESIHRLWPNAITAEFRGALEQLWRNHQKGSQRTKLDARRLDTLTRNMLEEVETFDLLEDQKFRQMSEAMQALGRL